MLEIRNLSKTHPNGVGALDHVAPQISAPPSRRLGPVGSVSRPSN